MQINVLPGTYACVHVCAILRKLGVGIRSSGTTYRWMVVSCHVLGTNPGSSARTSSSINPPLFRKFKSDWLNCQNKDSMIMLKVLLKDYDHDGKKKSGLKQNKVSVPVSWIQMSIMLAASGKRCFLEVIYLWLLQSLHILLCIDLSLVRV